MPADGNTHSGAVKARPVSVGSHSKRASARPGPLSSRGAPKKPSPVQSPLPFDGNELNFYRRLPASSGVDFPAVTTTTKKFSPPSLSVLLPPVHPPKREDRAGSSSPPLLRKKDGSTSPQQHLPRSGGSGSPKPDSPKSGSPKLPPLSGVKASAPNSKLLAIKKGATEVKPQKEDAVQALLKTIDAIASDPTIRKQVYARVKEKLEQDTDLDKVVYYFEGLKANELETTPAPQTIVATTAVVATTQPVPLKGTERTLRHYGKDAVSLASITPPSKSTMPIFAVINNETKLLGTVLTVLIELLRKKEYMADSIVHLKVQEIVKKNKKTKPITYSSHLNNKIFKNLFETKQVSLDEMKGAEVSVFACFGDFKIKKDGSPDGTYDWGFKHGPLGGEVFNIFVKTVLSKGVEKIVIYCVDHDDITLEDTEALTTAKNVLSEYKNALDKTIQKLNLSDDDKKKLCFVTFDDLRKENTFVGERFKKVAADLSAILQDTTAKDKFIEALVIKTAEHLLKEYIKKFPGKIKLKSTNQEEKSVRPERKTSSPVDKGPMSGTVSPNTAARARNLLGAARQIFGPSGEPLTDDHFAATEYVLKTKKEPNLISTSELAKGSDYLLPAASNGAANPEKKRSDEYNKAPVGYVPGVRQFRSSNKADMQRPAAKKAVDHELHHRPRTAVAVTG